MTGKPQISPQKWEQMRRHYLTGNIILKELSELYGVGYSTVRRYASANDWFARRRSQNVLIESEARNRLSQQLLEQAAGLQETAGYCIPMSKEKHYDLLIRLLHLQMRLKLQRASQELEETPRADNVIPLRQTRRPPATRTEQSHGYYA